MQRHPGENGRSTAVISGAAERAEAALSAMTGQGHGEDVLVVAQQFQVRARASEAAMIEHALVFLERRAAEAEASREPLQAQKVARRAAVRQIARALGQAERSTAAGLNAAEFARHALPMLWATFIEGAVDFARLRRVAQTAVRLEDQGLVDRLDAEVGAHARTKTLGELQSWLNRRVATLDAEAHARLCRRSQADRWVRVEHHEDGTSLLEARIPTLAAAAIEKRLAAAARGLETPACPEDPASSAGAAEAPGALGHLVGAGPDDRPADSDAAEHPAARRVSGTDQRTLEQRQADLLCAWLQDGRVYQTPVTATICVMIPQATLTGESQAPGMAADRSWMLPAAQARALAGNGATHRWYTAATTPRAARQQPPGTHRSEPDPWGPDTRGENSTEGLAEHDVDVLSVIHHGYTPPARLREAVIFRDGVCAAEGCTVPAERCDIDHRVPYHQGGPTTGSNLQALCRSHHRMKSHGHPLTTEPTPGTQSSDSRRTPAPVQTAPVPADPQEPRSTEERIPDSNDTAGRGHTPDRQVARSAVHLWAPTTIRRPQPHSRRNTVKATAPEAPSRRSAPHPHVAAAERVQGPDQKDEPP